MNLTVDTENYLQVYYHKKKVISVDIENEVLASGSFDGKIQVWNMTSDSQLFQVSHEDEVLCVKVVGKKIVSCGDTTVRIWNLEDGKLLHKLQLPDLCHNFDLNPEKTLLAVAHYIGVSIWDFQNLAQISEIELDRVMDVRFNEQGTRLIAGQKNGQIYKIDVMK